MLRTMSNQGRGLRGPRGMRSSNDFSISVPVVEVASQAALQSAIDAHVSGSASLQLTGTRAVENLSIIDKHNLTVDLLDATFGITGHAGVSFLGIFIGTTVNDPGYHPTAGIPAISHVSHPTGIIGGLTDYVLMKDEIVGVSPGNELAVHWGPNPYDPAEPYHSYKMTVASVGFTPGGGTPHDGTGTNVTYDASGGHFNGTDSKVTTGYLLNLNTDGAFTVCFELQTSTTGVHQFICGDSRLGNDANNAWLAYIDATTGELVFYVPTFLANMTTDSVQTTGHVVNDGVRRLVTITYSAKAVKIYFGGTLVASKTLTIASSTTLSAAGYGFVIGTSYLSSNGNYQLFFNGILANVRIFHGAKDSQVAAYAATIGQGFATVAASSPELLSGIIIGFDLTASAADSSNGVWKINFTSPFPYSSQVYASIDDLRTHTDPSNYYKIGNTAQWGEFTVNSNGDTQSGFGWGLGLDGGIEVPTTGRWSSNIKIKGKFTSALPPLTDYTLWPKQARGIFGRLVDGLTIQDTTWINVAGSAIHTELCRLTIRNMAISGTGAARQADSGLVVAVAVTAWSGLQHLFDTISNACGNCPTGNYERGFYEWVMRNISDTQSMDATHLIQGASSLYGAAAIFGLNPTMSGHTIGCTGDQLSEISNGRLNYTDPLNFASAFSPTSFLFANHDFAGFNFGGEVYDSVPQTFDETYPLPANSGADSTFNLPAAIYAGGLTAQITTPGNITIWRDGNTADLGTVGAAAQITLLTGGINAGTGGTGGTYAAYKSNSKLIFTWNGTTPGAVRITGTRFNRTA